MQSKRFVAIGALIGIFAGILISFLFPDLLMFGAQYNSSSNNQLVLPDYTLKSGSILNSLMVLPVLMGITGSIIGLVLFKVIRSK